MMMRRLDEEVGRFALPLHTETALRESEQSVPQARRTLIDDESRYRQIQGEPYAYYL